MKKRQAIIFALMLCTVTSFAQYKGYHQRSRYNRDNTEHYYGLRLGLNVASLSSDNLTEDATSRAGLNVGGVFGLQLANHTPIWLETGLFYSEKGGKSTYLNAEIKYRLCYLKVPIVVKYSFDVYDDLYIQPYLGGYLSVGIEGRTKEYATHEAYSTYNVFNRFDAGLRIGCGIEYKMVYAEMGYDLGLANISKNDFTSTHTRTFFVNIGVNF